MRAISSENEYDKLIDSIRSGFSVSPRDMILPSPLGPIKVGDLTFLEGWRYELLRIGWPGAEVPIVLGGPGVTLSDFTDEKGWVLTFSAWFRSPFGSLNFTADNWIFQAAPFIVNTALGWNLPNNILVYCPVYNPFTPLGPLYGLTFAPSYPIPYERTLRLTLNLPAGVPIAATTIWSAGVGRIWIQDERIFLRSVKKFMLEQMTGQRIERYP